MKNQRLLLKWVLVLNLVSPEIRAQQNIDCNDVKKRVTPVFNRVDTALMGFYREVSRNSHLDHRALMTRVMALRNTLLQVRCPTRYRPFFNGDGTSLYHGRCFPETFRFVRNRDNELPEEPNRQRQQHWEVRHPGQAFQVAPLYSVEVIDINQNLDQGQVQVCYRNYGEAASPSLCRFLNFREHDQRRSLSTKVYTNNTLRTEVSCVQEDTPALSQPHEGAR